ncbi:MAG: lysophospholipid acyltransferase family protein [Chitinophagales bacterium]|nr:lysophospholipid acyltransferase family protein [Chitinophagales bacterium]
MKLLTIPLRVLYTLYACCLFWLLGFVTAFIYIIILLLPLSKLRKGDVMYEANWWFTVVFGAFTGICYKVIGKTAVDWQRTYVMVANHNAIADVFIMVNPLRGIRYRPLAKIELLSVPIFGFLFKYTLIFVDRKNPNSRRGSITELRKLINEDHVSPFIFPEGTRNRTGKPLKEFFDGAFRIAIDTQTPILPLVYMGTKQITPQGVMLMRPGVLTCIFLPPIETIGLTVEDLPMLKQKVFSDMEKAILAN